MQREMEPGGASLLPADSDSPEVDSSTSTDALGVTSVGLPGPEPTQSHFAIQPELFGGYVHIDAEASKTNNFSIATLPHAVHSRNDGNHTNDFLDLFSKIAEANKATQLTSEQAEALSRLRESSSESRPNQSAGLMAPSRNLYQFPTLAPTADMPYLPPSPPGNSPPSPLKSPGGRPKTNDRLKELMHIHVPGSPVEGPSVFNTKLFDEDIEVQQPRKAGQLRREDGTTEECSEMRLPLKYAKQTVLFQEVRLEHPKNYKIEDENEKNSYKDIVMECKVITQKHPRGWDFENNRGSWLEFRPDKSNGDMLWEYKVEVQTEFQGISFQLATTMQVDQVVGQITPTWQDVVKRLQSRLSKWMSYMLNSNNPGARFQATGPIPVGYIQGTSAGTAKSSIPTEVNTRMPVREGSDTKFQSAAVPRSIYLNTLSHPQTVPRTVTNHQASQGSCGGTRGHVSTEPGHGFGMLVRNDGKAQHKQVTKKSQVKSASVAARPAEQNIRKAEKRPSKGAAFYSNHLHSSTEDAISRDIPYSTKRKIDKLDSEINDSATKHGKKSSAKPRGPGDQLTPTLHPMNLGESHQNRMLQDDNRNNQTGFSSAKPPVLHPHSAPTNSNEGSQTLPPERTYNVQSYRLQVQADLIATNEKLNSELQGDRHVSFQQTVGDMSQKIERGKEFPRELQQRQQGSGYITQMDPQSRLGQEYGPIHQNSTFSAATSCFANGVQLVPKQPQAEGGNLQTSGMHRTPIDEFNPVQLMTGPNSVARKEDSYQGIHQAMQVPVNSYQTPVLQHTGAWTQQSNRPDSNFQSPNDHREIHGKQLEILPPNDFQSYNGYQRQETTSDIYSPHPLNGPVHSKYQNAIPPVAMDQLQQNHCHAPIIHDHSARSQIQNRWDYQRHNNNWELASPNGAQVPDPLYTSTSQAQGVLEQSHRYQPPFLYLDGGPQNTVTGRLHAMQSQSSSGSPLSHAHGQYDERPRADRAHVELAHPAESHSGQTHPRHSYATQVSGQKSIEVTYRPPNVSDAKWNRLQNEVKAVLAKPIQTSPIPTSLHERNAPDSAQGL